MNSDSFSFTVVEGAVYPTLSLVVSCRQALLDALVVLK